VGVLVALLVVTNLATLGVLAWALLRPAHDDEPDDVVASALDRGPRPSGALGTRRIITIEILNPIELAGSRSRMAGIAGSIVPGITRRVVYDQALRQIRRDMREHHVVADVRLHTIRPVPAQPAGATVPAPSTGDTPAEAPGEAAVYYDEIRRLDLDDIDERGA
jgi:hypothetical protein